MAYYNGETPGAETIHVSKDGVPVSFVEWIDTTKHKMGLMEVEGGMPTGKVITVSTEGFTITGLPKAR